MAGGRLPVELLHSILRELGKPSLSACSQTCRFWVNISRHYLFENITHRAKQGLPLEDLLEYLTSTPAVCAHIRRLTLVEPRSNKLKALVWLKKLEYRDYMNGRPVNLCRFEILIAILRQLPYLHTLVLGGLLFYPPEAEVHSQTVVTSPVVATLKTLRVSQWSDTNILHLLNLFGEVDHLSVSRMWSTGIPTATIASRIPLRIRSLALHDSLLPITTLLPLPRVSDLSAVEFPSTDVSEAPLALQLLNIVGPCLQHFGLKLHELRAARNLDLTYLEPITSVTFAALRSLSVIIPVYVFVRSSDADETVQPFFPTCGCPLFPCQAHQDAATMGTDHLGWIPLLFEESIFEPPGLQYSQRDLRLVLS